MPPRTQHPATPTDTTVFTYKHQSRYLLCRCKNKVFGEKGAFHEIHLPEGSIALLYYNLPGKHLAYIIRSTTQGTTTLPNLSRTTEILCKATGNHAGRLRDAAKKIEENNDGSLELDAQGYIELEMSLSSKGLEGIIGIVRRSRYRVERFRKLNLIA